MKTIKISTIIFFTSILFIACNNNTQKENTVDKKDSTTMSSSKTDSVKYTALMVENAKDPTCGMPVGAGIEDTLHYNDKAIGFCSKECKNEFVKNAPKSFATVEWKK
ncbi:MAG TPA: hypothetical protein VHP12_07395 [Chitinophagaceae bacterium]|nr:hypothetical protein [Chitinophagaceae bacterium]